MNPRDLFIALNVLDPVHVKWHTEWITIPGRWVMKYYLWYKQSNGCDYTVSCGETVTELKGVEDPDSAWTAAVALLREGGFYDPGGDRLSLEFARVIATADEPFELSLYALEQQIKSERDTERDERDRQKDEQEFERLRQKLDK